MSPADLFPSVGDLVAAAGWLTLIAIGAAGWREQRRVEREHARARHPISDRYQLEGWRR